MSELFAYMSSCRLSKCTRAGCTCAVSERMSIFRDRRGQAPANCLHLWTAAARVLAGARLRGQTSVRCQFVWKAVDRSLATTGLRSSSGQPWRVVSMRGYLMCASRCTGSCRQERGRPRCAPIAGYDVCFDARTAVGKSMHDSNHGRPG